MFRSTSAATMLVIAFALAAEAKEGDDPAIVQCEVALKEKLRSPRSYERIDAWISVNEVYIKYDAANVYNAVLRETEVCEFSLNAVGQFFLAPNGLSEASHRSVELRNLPKPSTREGLEERVNAMNASVAELSKLMQLTVEKSLVSMSLGLEDIPPSQTRLQPYASGK